MSNTLYMFKRDIVCSFQQARDVLFSKSPGQYIKLLVSVPFVWSLKQDDELNYILKRMRERFS